MTQRLHASIRWLAAEDGGRLRPPSGPKYWTVANFEGSSPGWPNEAWSVVVEFLEPPENDGNAVMISFLAANAPAGLLVPGATFELMEGPHVVARGVVSADQHS